MDELTVVFVDGSTRVVSDYFLEYVVDATAETGPVGVYHPCGAYNVTIVTGDVPTGVYAANGSYNVVVDDETYTGFYHPCGAYRVTDVTPEI